MITKELESYILDHIDEEDDILRELDRETHLKVLRARMISGHLQGKVLTMLTKMIRPLRVLEIGTFTGYSALCIGKGMPAGGKLITIELDDELEYLSSKYFKKAGMNKVIEQQTGPALEVLSRLEGDFDLVFIDADKREYIDYFEKVFPMVPQGGYIFADNTLWNGKVLEEPSKDDEQTRGILAFNSYIKEHPEVEKVILPLRDGMTIIRKK